MKNGKTGMKEVKTGMKLVEKTPISSLLLFVELGV